MRSSSYYCREIKYHCSTGPPTYSKRHINHITSWDKTYIQWHRVAQPTWSELSSLYKSGYKALRNLFKATLKLCSNVINIWLVRKIISWYSSRIKCVLPITVLKLNNITFIELPLVRLWGDMVEKKHLMCKLYIGNNIHNMCTWFCKPCRRISFFHFHFQWAVVWMKNIIKKTLYCTLYEIQKSNSLFFI